MLNIEEWEIMQLKKKFLLKFEIKSLFTFSITAPRSDIKQQYECFGNVVQNLTSILVSLI